MRITRITLPSIDVDACLAFYRDVMQLRTLNHTVQVGWTRIDIVPAAEDTGSVHLAFNIPRNRFAAACAWVAERAMLLRDPMGEERFHLDGAWQSDSVYFAGPHGSVLELIARHPLDLDGPRNAPFHGQEIACVSELGLPTSDVPGLVRSLVTRMGIQPFGDISDAFAPMGTHEGLLIVVDRRRLWFPELRQPPGAKGVAATLDGVLPESRVVDGLGWTLTGAMPVDLAWLAQSRRMVAY